MGLIGLAYNLVSLGGHAVAGTVRGIGKTIEFAADFAQAERDARDWDNTVELARNKDTIPLFYLAGEYAKATRAYEDQLKKYLETARADTAI